VKPTTSVQPFLGAGNKEQNIAIAFAGVVAGFAAWGML